MLHGGYAVLALQPGPHKLETSPDFTIRAWLPGIILIIRPLAIYGELIAENISTVELDLVAGETKYVCCRFAERKLVVVPVDAANRALQDCRGQ